MRFTSVFVAGALAIAARAQSTTEDDTPSPTFTLDPVQSSIIACIDECDPTDVNCLADCNPVPRPNESQAIDTTECVANCDQGEGTEEDIAAYEECSWQCIQDLFYTDGEGTPDGGNDSSSGDDTTSAPAATETSEDDAEETAGTDEPTESGASPTESDSEDDAEETGSETTTGSGDATETAEDDGSAATALVGSALAGALVLMLAL